MKDNSKILVIIILLILTIILYGFLTDNIKIEYIKNFEYQTINGEKGNSRECFKQNNKLYCIVEVEWYANYGGKN